VYIRTGSATRKIFEHLSFLLLLPCICIICIRGALRPFERLTVSVIYRIVTKTIGPVIIRSPGNVLLYTDGNITIISERLFSADVDDCWQLSLCNIIISFRDHSRCHLFTLFDLNGRGFMDVATSSSGGISRSCTKTHVHFADLYVLRNCEESNLNTFEQDNIVNKTCIICHEWTVVIGLIIL
jgi:hypothetical protein